MGASRVASSDANAITRIYTGTSRELAIADTSDGFIALAESTPSVMTTNARRFCRSDIFCAVSAIASHSDVAPYAFVDSHASSVVVNAVEKDRTSRNDVSNA